MLVQYIYVFLVTEFGNFFFLLGVDRYVWLLDFWVIYLAPNLIPLIRKVEIVTVITALIEAMVQIIFVSRVWRCKFLEFNINFLI